jgi:hypothetical protein
MRAASYVWVTVTKEVCTIYKKGRAGLSPVSFLYTFPGFFWMPPSCSPAGSGSAPARYAPAARGLPRVVFPNLFSGPFTQPVVPAASVARSKSFAGKQCARPLGRTGRQRGGPHVRLRQKKRKRRTPGARRPHHKNNQPGCKIADFLCFQTVSVAAAGLSRAF